MKSPEHDLQVTLFNWADMQTNVYPDLACMYAVPNGGHRHKTVAAKLKAEGVKSGVPDICLPVPRGRYHGLYIELKIKPNKPSANQLKWLAMLEEQGHLCAVAYDLYEAIGILKLYLKEPKPNA